MTPIDDDELRAMLEARAARAPHVALGDVIAGRSRTTRTPWLTAAFAGAVATITAVVLIVVLARPDPAAPTGSATVSDDAGPVATQSAAPSAIEGAITADELDRLLRARGAVGRIVILDGELVPAAGACTASPWCAQAVVGLTTPHVLLPSDAGAAGSQLTSNRTTDLYALRVEPSWVDGMVRLNMLGRVEANRGAMLWPVETLATDPPDTAAPYSRLGEPPPSDLVEVAGWIGRSPIHSCPSTFRSGCTPTDDFLSADAYQPVQIDGSTIGPSPETSIDLVSGAYDTWAPDPEVLARGVEPRQVTLLVRLATPCNPARRGASCVAPPHDMWEVVARLDPLP